MNSHAMVSRMAQAIEIIRRETERLGGQLDVPEGRVSDPQVRSLLVLEAVAAALGGIAFPQPVEKPKSSRRSSD